MPVLVFPSAPNLLHLPSTGSSVLSCSAIASCPPRATMSSIASRSDTTSHPPSPHAVSSPSNSITPQLSAAGDISHNLSMPTASLPPASASASASTSQVHAPVSVPSPSGSPGHSAFSAASASRSATSSTPIPGSYLVTSLVTPSGTIPLQAQPVTDSTQLFATSSATTTQGANSSQQQTQTAPVGLRPKDFEVTVPTAFRALPSASSGTMSMSMSNLMVTPKMSPAAQPLGAQLISVPSPQLTIQPQGVTMGAPLQHFGYPLLSFPTSSTLLVQMPQASEFLMPYMTAQGSMVNMMAMPRLAMDTTPRPVLATSQPALAVQTVAAMAVDNSGSKTPTSNNGSLKVPNGTNFGSPRSVGHHKMSSAATASNMLLKLRAQASSSLSLQSVNSTRSSASSGSRTPEAHGDEELRFGCTQCGNAFKNKGGLTRHMRVHTGEKPYMCTMCGKRFNQKGHLTIHFRSHTGETPFSCDDCGKHFKTRSDMKRHQRVHTGEKNFACPTCSRRFTRKTGLKKHVCGSVPGQTAPSPAASS